MIKIHAKRLLEVADKVEAMTDRFNFEHWVGQTYAGNPDLSCGTTACALGWATTLPSLQKLGLRLASGGVNIPVIVSPKTRTTDNLLSSIGRRLFGLTGAETRYLFVPYNGISEGESGIPSNVTGEQWASYCRKFVAEKLIASL